MKRMKKVLALLVAVLLLCSAVAGCGTKSGDTSTTAAVTTEAAGETEGTTAAAVLPEAKLTMYFMDAGPQVDQDLVFGKVNEYVKSKINATVEFKPIGGGDYVQKMQVVIASSEDYDMCFTAPWLNGSNYAQNVSKGAFLPLDDLLPKYAPQRWEALVNYWDATRINGKIYGFINEQIFARTACISIEKEIAEKYNLDGTFKTGDLSSLTPLAEAVFKDDPKRYLEINYTDMPELFGMEYVGGGAVPVGVLLDDQNMKAFNYFEHPNFLKYVNLMREWNKKGFTHSAERLAVKEGDQSDMQQHNKIFTVGGCYKPGINEEISASTGFPMIGKPVGTPTLTTSSVIATMIAVSRNSKNPERSVMFLELLNTDAKLYNMLNFGIEGTHYTVEDGFMIKSNSDENNKRYAPGVPWELGTNFLAYPLKGQPATVWEDTKKLNDSAQKSVLFGFTFDSEPVKNEVSKCGAVIDEYRRSISLGITDDTKYNAFLAKLKAAGADAIVTEAQKQIDAWKTTK